MFPTLALDQLNGSKGYSVEQGASLRPLFEAVVYSSSWVMSSVKLKQAMQVTYTRAHKVRKLELGVAMSFVIMVFCEKHVRNGHVLASSG